MLIHFLLSSFAIKAPVVNGSSNSMIMSLNLILFAALFVCTGTGGQNPGVKSMHNTSNCFSLAVTV